MADEWLRVTEILRLAGLVDFSGIAPDVLERARARGVAVHSWIEGYHFIGEESMPPAIEGYCKAYLGFLGQHVEEVISVEEEVSNPTYRYRGRLDLRVVIKGQPWVLDIKATAQVPEVAGIQLAGYQLAVTDGHTHRRAVLHLKPGSWSLVEYRNHREDQHMFLACLRVARWLLDHGRVQLDG